MKYYVGHYSSGKVKVFKTDKAITKKSFPWYTKVVGPFDSEQEAWEYGREHGIRHPELRKERELSLNPGTGWEIYRAFGREAAAQDEVQDLRDEGREAKVVYNPNSKQWEAWFYRTVSRYRRNPGAELHGEQATNLRKIEEELKGKEREFYRGARMAHESSMRLSRYLGINPRHQGIKFITGILKTGGGTKVQSVVFGRDAWKVPQAKRWLKKYGFYHGVVEHGQNYLRFRQADPSRFDRATFATITPGESAKVREKRALSRNPKRIVSSEAPSHCRSCGHVMEAHHKLPPSRSHYRERSYCKLCDCQMYLPELEKNPPTRIYDRIHAIEAQKGKDSNFPGEDFRHDFKGGATIEGMPDGSLRVKSKTGKRLWKEFNY